MKILIILRDLYNNSDLFDDEKYLSKSDRNIITEALKIKDENNAEVSALLFGEDNAFNEQTLKKALSMGIDKSFHILSNDADLTNIKLTSKVIKNFVHKYYSDVDLILFGRLSYTGDALEIATDVAENLEFKRVIYSKEFSLKDNNILAKREIDNTEYLYKLKTPLVIQSVRDKDLTRHPKISDILLAYEEKEIIKINLDDLINKKDLEKNSLKFIESFSPDSDNKKEIKMLNGISDLESAENLIDTLRKLGF